MSNTVIRPWAARQPNSPLKTRRWWFATLACAAPLFVPVVASVLWLTMSAPTLHLLLDKALQHPIRLACHLTKLANAAPQRSDLWRTLILYPQAASLPLLKGVGRLEHHVILKLAPG